jgi:hypothetical protein
LLSGPHIDISFGDDLMNAGRDVISAIHTMRLVVDYDSKPLLNGHQVMQILKNVPKNDFKVINEEIVRWQLSQPPEMRTEEAITAHLLDKYSAYR